MKATYSANKQKTDNRLSPNVAISPEELVNLPIGQIFERLDTSQHGLTSDEVNNRIETYGYNELIQKKKRTILYELLHHISNPLMVILLIAGLISGILGETINAVIIFSIVIISIGLDLFQESKAEKAAELLKAKVATTATALRNGVGVQFNVTLTQQNYTDLEAILSLAKSLSATGVHLFFLVPTGRAKTMQDLTPQIYEDTLRQVLSRRPDGLEVKPTCAPQFMRIAREMNVDTTRWSRGCIAAINYCRILPNGTVTPCPYLPVKAGNLREVSFADIWANSEVLKTLRDWKNLKGKCGACGYQAVCGGCRARAYGLTSFCSGASSNSSYEGDFLAEDTWCAHQPHKKTS